MRLPGIRKKSIRWLSVMFMALLAAGGITALAAPGTAFALGPGKVCMYLAPNAVGGLGHVGWEFQEPGRGYWYGATEDANTTWIRFSTSENQVHADFKNYAPGYYSEYRCHSTSVSAVGAAETQANATKTNGYWIPGNDCLTKAASIYGAYDSSLDFMWAATFNYPGPKAYFNNFLPAPGVSWGPIHYL